MRPRDRAWRLSAAAVLLAAADLPAAAADKPCTGADKAFDGVTSWAALQKAVDGLRPLRQGPDRRRSFTEAVLRVVIGGWPKVGDAGPYPRQGRGLQEAGSRGSLSSTDLSTQDSAEIRDLAKIELPQGAGTRSAARSCSRCESGRALSAPELLQLDARASPAPAKKP